MEKIYQSAKVIVAACDLNPIFSIVVVGLAYLAFNLVEAMIEDLIFGERFLHWLDPIFGLAFIAYGGLCVYQCAYWKNV